MISTGELEEINQIVHITHTGIANKACFIKTDGSRFYHQYILQSIL